MCKLLVPELKKYFQCHHIKFTKDCFLNHNIQFLREAKCFIGRQELILAMKSF